MGRIRAAFFTLLSGAITALFVWLLQTDSGLGQNFLIGGALFFGAATLVPLSFLISARAPPEDADGATTVPNSTLRCFFMALALVAVTAASLLIWPEIAESGSWRKYAFLIIPIPCALLALKYLQWGLSGQPAYRFDSQGVTRYQWGERRTPWDAVTDVRILKLNGTENVVLDVTRAHREQLSWWSKLGASTGFGALTLPSGATGLPPKDIEKLARRYWRPGA